MNEELFRQGVSRLEKANIKFWVDCGTLLGMIRDGRPIPWDEDFDFSVWRHEVTEEMIKKAFDNDNFVIESLTPHGNDNIHIVPINREIKGIIDISFYTRQNELAVLRGAILKITFRTKLMKSLERFLAPSFKAEQWYKYLLEELFHKGFKPLFPRKLRARIKDYLSSLFLKYERYDIRAVVTYEYSAHYFENLRPVTFLGVEVNIPEDAEEYLEVAYGKDWRTPKKWEHWWEGASYINGQRNVQE